MSIERPWRITIRAVNLLTDEDMAFNAEAGRAERCPMRATSLCHGGDGGRRYVLRLAVRRRTCGPWRARTPLRRCCLAALAATGRRRAFTATARRRPDTFAGADDLPDRSDL